VTCSATFRVCLRCNTRTGQVRSSLRRQGSIGHRMMLVVTPLATQDHSRSPSSLGRSACLGARVVVWVLKARSSQCR
jgi:hypothetical protein